MRWTFATAVLLAPFLSARGDEPKPEAADAVMTDALKAFQVPGAALVVVRGDQTLVLKGYGYRSIDAKDPVTPDTSFPLASCTKQFTTALLAMLVDDGKLDWDDPVKKHLPDFKLSDPNASALLTVRDLVTHRTGLASHDLLWYRAPWSIDHILKQVPLLPLEYPFRSGYRYNSITFMAAGRIAERCGKEKWEKLVRERLIDPLEMKGVTFTTTEIAKDADRALGHQLNKTGKIERAPIYEMKEPNPSGSMNATARDLVSWLQFHVSDGVAPSGQRLVSSKPLLETRTPQNLMRLEGAAKFPFPDTVQLSYAMGWVVNDYRGLKVVAHGGLIDGFRIQITLVPEKDLGFAVLTNLHDTRMPIAATNTLVDLYCDLKPKDWNAHFRKLVDDEAEAKKAALAARDMARDPNAKPSLPLTALAGEYTNPAYGTATVRFADGKLTATFGAFTYPLEHYERDTFRVTGGRFETELATFTVTDKKVKGLTLSGIEFKTVPPAR
ncbi:Esterase EstB [Gemmata sp. SH-PL17]|uniref:serine hydrolase n=1 Tax=Gemmata sp. SH-PL17 TaxID=1630693 RepID=UPI00078BF6B0|nr:serine hydrolase [Gemmata sp. SH-PL17]AMV30364.1 Esterase EstB [Gemmata sp. SH-PL17]